MRCKTGTANNAATYNKISKKIMLMLDPVKQKVTEELSREDKPSVFSP